MERPTIEPMRTSRRLSFLDDQQLKDLQESTLQILENHHPEPPSDDIQKEINRILSSAEKELKD